MKGLTVAASLLSLAIGVLLFVVSVAGVFWPATPATDPGMLSTVMLFALMGLLGLLLVRVRARRSEENPGAAPPRIES